ncbi:M56 family metallopeptidase [Pseudofulvibacter geojedonensis]|uniref:M56 family metallopeptidase n=1 Tax=Pseudofulvibacter geojedonensis TaxID=1123758 RepID=A0ABW3I071_9FLAO
MGVYLLKSAACLAIFLIFYKLLLEKESIHKLKRYYLLVSLLLSFIIPLTSYTSFEYVKAMEVLPNSNTISIIEDIPEEKTLSIEIIFLTIYAFISGIFLFFFIKNLWLMAKKIQANEKNTSENTTKVLLKELIVPHTFLKYIFINKTEYNNNSIPKSVIAHEEAHAKQKHSVDILLLECLHILFWFNPLIYLYKRAIKLNHEFLADEAVINKGYETKAYQQTLLAYSSHATLEYSNYFGLANAINYSSIKKRLTVMKTKTTKKTVWLRSLLILPLVALLLFSFSTKEIIYQEKATKQMVAEYNKLAKKYNAQDKNNRVVLLKDIQRLEYIYKLMTPEQKKNAEPFPDCPPPPPPPPPYPEDADYFINDQKASINEVNEINPENIQSVFVSGKDKPGKPRLDVFTKDYRGVVAPKPPKILKLPKNDGTKFLPAPEYPADAYCYINGKKTSMKEVKKLDSETIKRVIISGKDESGKVLKKPILEVYTIDYKGPEPSPSKYTNRPGAKINGKVCEGCMLQMTKEQLKNSYLSLQENGKIIMQFRVKAPKKPTVTCIGSILNDEAIKVIDNANKGQIIQLFDIRVDGLKTKPPILITLLD